MVQSALAKLLGSDDGAEIVEESEGEKASDSDGTALSDDEDVGPLALKVGGTMMFYTTKVNSAPIHLLDKDASDGKWCRACKTCNAKVAFHAAKREPAWRMLAEPRNFGPKCKASYSADLLSFVFSSS